MKKLLKYATFGLIGLVIVALAIVAVVVATFNPNDYKPLIVKLVHDKKQRTLNIEGDIKLAFWPKIGADLGKISLSEHNGDQEFAAVDGLKVSLALLPLLKKELIVDTVYIDGARANIVRHKDGSTNFDDLLSADESESEQIKFDVSGIVVTNSAVNYHDQQDDNRIELSKFNLKTGHVALAAPFDMSTDFALKASKPALSVAAAVSGNFMADPDDRHYAAKGLDARVQGDFAGGKDVVVKLSGDVDARPDGMEFLVDGLKLALSGNFDGAKTTLDLAAPKLVVQKDEVSGKEVKLSLSQEKAGDTIKANLALADVKGSPRALQSSGVRGDIAAKQGARTVQGKFSSPFSGNIETLVFDLPKLAGNLDVKDPALPKGAMQGDFDLNLHADVKKEQVSSAFKLAIDDTKLRGDVAVAGFKQPDIRFNLDADRLDLNKLLGQQPAAGKTKAADAGPAAAPDLSALKTLRLAGKVAIGSILYDKYRIDTLNLGIKADGDRLSVSPFDFKLDESKIKGSFAISRFARPIYHFDVDIDKLDADRYIAATEGQAPPAAGKDAPAADTPIDLSALKSINADGELRIGWLKLANVKSTNVRIKLKADEGVAQLAPFSANLYEGAMNGSLQVDARGTPSIGFKQTMTGIAIGPLLVDAINNDMLSGKGSLNVDVTTSGATVNTLKKSLNGTAALNLADGAVKGIDIAGTIRGYKDKLNALKGSAKVEGDKSRKTDFSEMVASFNIKNGVAHNDDLSMKAPLFRITGSGDVDIANETIDYLAKPTIVKSLAGQGGAGLDELSGLTIPVKLTGTFAKPDYALDFAGMTAALAQKKVLDKVGGDKGEAVQKLLEGDTAGGLKGLLNKEKEAPAATEEAPAADEPQPVEQQPAEAPKKKEDKVKSKLNKLLGK